MPLPTRNTLNPAALKAKREALNLTQEQAGKLAIMGRHPGVSWSKYEYGKVPHPGGDVLRRLARALQCAPEELLEVPAPATTPTTATTTAPTSSPDDDALRAAYAMGYDEGLTAGTVAAYAEGRDAGFADGFAQAQALCEKKGVVPVPAPVAVVPVAGAGRCPRCGEVLDHDGTGHALGCPELGGDALAALTGT